MWGATSLDEVIDEVVDGHDDGRVVDFSDGGGAMTNVGDLLKELFSSELEVMVNWCGDWLWVEWWDWESGRHSIDCMDFVTIVTDKGVLF
jgi:hypothetical protein